MTWLSTRLGEAMSTWRGRAPEAGQACSLAYCSPAGNASPQLECLRGRASTGTFSGEVWGTPDFLSPNGHLHQVPVP